MKKFAANVLLWTKSGAGPVDNVGKGEAAVGVVFHTTSSQARKRAIPSPDLPFRW
jgi:ABC-type Fe3+ transport system substrate-binding protein